MIFITPFADFTISWVAVRSFLYDSFSLYAAHNLSAKIRCSSMGGKIEFVVFQMFPLYSRR